MPTSKAQQRAVHRYVKSNYDRMEIVVPKGRKAEIKAHATNKSESVNGFVNRAILETMEHDTSQQPSESPTRAANQLVGIITPDTLKAAQKAAKTNGEDILSFITRAVETEVKRYNVSWSLGINPATGEKVTKGGKKNE